MEDPKALYLDLLKKCLTNWIYGEHEVKDWARKGFWKRLISGMFAPAGVRLVKDNPFDPRVRALGQDHPPTAHTMVGLKRLDNLQHCIETALKDGVPGDLIETGAWRGGACIFMRAVLMIHGVQDRTVWVADSFEGLPPPDPGHYPADAGDEHHLNPRLQVTLEDVKANFEKYGLLDDRVRFLKGWFKDTLPSAPIERLAVLRLDGDMYESTWQALEALYPRLSPGGFVIVDDYSAVEGCRKAVDDFRKSRGILDPVEPIDPMAVYWRRS